MQYLRFDPRGGIVLKIIAYAMVFQDLSLFPGLSRPGILNNKIPGLSKVCTNLINGQHPESTEFLPFSKIWLK